MTPPPPAVEVADGYLKIREDLVPYLADALRARAELAARDGSRITPGLEKVAAAAVDIRRALVTELKRHRVVPPPEQDLAPSGSAGPPLVEVDLLPTSAVARRLGITPRAVRKAARAGRVVAHRGESSWGFDEHVVNEWIQNREATGVVMKARAEEKAAAERAAKRREETAEIRRLLSEVEAEIAQLDGAELKELERVRDAAIAVYETSTHPSQSLQRFRAAEEKEKAEAGIQAILDRLRPLKERRSKLQELYAPTREAESEYAQLLAAEEGCLKLREALEHMDQAVAAIEEARPLMNRGRRGLGPNSGFTKFVTTYGRGGWDRHRMEFSTIGECGLVDVQQRLARMRAEGVGE